MAKKGFLRIPNALLEDPELSLVECVVLSRVMSFPDGYMGTHRHLGNSVKLSKVGVQKILQRLVEKRYIKKEVKDENGVTSVVYRCYTGDSGVTSAGCRGAICEMSGNKNIYKKEEKENYNKRNFDSGTGTDGTEVPHDAAFNEVWRVMGRGDIDKAREEWQGLTEEDKQKVTRHIRHYVDQQKNYRQPLEKYLHNRLFDTMIYSDGGGVRFDPNTPDIDYTREYCPSPDGNVYQKKDGRWYYGGVYVSSDDIRDGLTWDMRPDGQVIYLDREPFAKIVWNRTEKAFKRL